MANPIKSIKRMEISEEAVRQHNLTEITDAVTSNKKAILEGIDLLVSLHESGALELLNALIKQKDEALNNITRQANKPKYASIIENASDLMLLIGELPMDELDHFIGKFKTGFKEARLSENKIDTSMMDLLKALKDPEINRSVSMLLGFLQGMGRK